MSDETTTPARPLSPWAEKYGVSFRDDLGDDKSHSLLNPIFPRLDPVFYNDLPESDVGETDLDQFLYSQRAQFLGPLNENLGQPQVHGGHSAVDYNPAENQRLHEERLLEVNEEGWFDFFKKERWWEPHGWKPVIDERKSIRTRPIRSWNPQNGRIWKELRIILEFCNRTLVKLIEEKDPWLDALLFGDLVYSDTSPVPRKSSSWRGRVDDPVWAIKYRSRAELSRQRGYFAQVRNELLRLTQFLIFGFRGLFSPASPEFERNGGASWAMTGLTMEQNPPGVMHPFVLINVANLRELVERSPTPAQASTARFGMACSILHELTHVLYLLGKDKFRVPFRKEAYMGEEQIREVGHSFENHLFGCSSASRPLPYVPIGDLCGQVMTHLVTSTDSAEIISSYSQLPRDGWGVPVYGEKPAPFSIVPPFVASYLFDESFWKNVVSKKGTKALQPASLMAWGGNTSVPTSHVDDFRGPLGQVRAAMEKRRKEVEARHGRQNPSRSQGERAWKNSLWSHVELRRNIARFRRFHSRAQHGACRRIATGLQETASRDRASVRQTPNPSLSAASSIIAGIAYLMMASLPAMPIRGGDTKSSNPPQIWRDPRAPKSRVPADFWRKWDTEEYEVTSIDGSNPQKLSHPEQYLWVIRTQLIDSGLLSTAPGLHQPWAAACIRSYNELCRLRGGTSSRARDWAAFNFRVPRFEVDTRLAAYPLPSWEPKAEAPVMLEPRAERCLLPAEIAQDSLLLIKTADPQGWSCYPIPPELLTEVSKVWVKTPYGKALPGNDARKGVRNLRASLRQSPSRGTLIPWYRKPEVAEFNAELGMSDWRVLDGAVYDISRFLQSEDGQGEAAQKAFQGPHQLDIDVGSLTRDVKTSLQPYRCGLIKPTNDTGTTFPQTSPLVLSSKELRSHDTPEHAYLDHHPAAYSILARSGGRDITHVFNQFHDGQLLTAIDMGDAKHTIVEVGRLVPVQTALRNDQIALKDFVFAIERLEVDEPARRRWAGKAVTPAEWRLADEGPAFDSLLGKCGELAVAKYEDVTAGTEARVVSKEELATHNAASIMDGQSAWVAAEEGDRSVVYDITGT
ncbi:cytochrome b5-like Heme/Steroid binding domain-containing protein [Apiospora marii]|uniref:Cytochrome b5-like Heme/Steroid binding domain-containing protein n=1 Tax=Apiospora marii TaxID=335849 RepID=A0ABR1R5E0_9PEZI